MTKIDKVRRELEWVRDELRRRLANIHQEMALNAIEPSIRFLLMQYEQALARMDDGMYGICTGCGSSIAHERLLAIPQATRCQECEAPAA